MPKVTDEGSTEILFRDGEQLKIRTRTIRIEVTGGPNAGQSVELAGPEIRIGTGKNVQLLLFDPTVSRHHITLRIETSGIRVVDQGSSNGTSIDGVRINDAFVRPDSIITLGETTLRLRLSSGTVELPVSSRERYGSLLGTSVPMRQLFTLLERIQPAEDPVLIQGETGTGKELVAEAIHEESPRSQGAFVVFDCSAVSANLVESELFGHVRGAFTGAHADREGAFEQADGGTIFLDEIGELPLDLQPKLLRALESFEVRRVGGVGVKRVNVRVIAATNRRLEEEVAQRRFREDLFYRLAVIRVDIPPLRSRRDDLPTLIDHFASEFGRGTRHLSPAARAELQRANYPGNVRELRNAVARAISLGVVQTERLEPMPPPDDEIDFKVPFLLARDKKLEDFERIYLLEALRRCGGNATKAADLAGVNRKFMQRAIKRYGLRATLDE